MKIFIASPLAKLPFKVDNLIRGIYYNAKSHEETQFKAPMVPHVGPRTICYSLGTVTIQLGRYIDTQEQVLGV